MKLKIMTFLMILVMAFALVGSPSSVQAAGYGTSFITAITYQNIGTAAASITLTFYAAESSTPILINLTGVGTSLPSGLAPNAGASIFVGNVGSVSAGFKGSAVMSSDQPLVAVMVQSPQGGVVRVRPLSSGFSGGASVVLVPTVLKNTYGYTSVVSIQNVDTVANDLAVELIPSSGSIINISVPGLPSGSAKYFDFGTLAQIAGPSFTGSMRVTASKAGTATPGSIVGTSLESGTSANLAYAFEGATVYGTTLYMPSAFCKMYSDVYNSTYAIQNVTTGPVDVTVTFKSSVSGTTYVEHYNGLANGAKVAAPGCGTVAAGNDVIPAGFIGSATITSTGNIAAIAKISNNTSLLTAFLGFVDGSTKTALPFVRWTQSQWVLGGRSRTNLAIQNIGASPLIAGAVTVKYYDIDGALVATHVLPAIPVGGKVNSNPKTAADSGGPGDVAGAGDEFGYVGTKYGGSAIVEGPAGSKLVIVARVSDSLGGTAIVGEDYSGTPMQ